VHPPAPYTKHSTWHKDSSQQKKWHSFLQGFLNCFPNIGIISLREILHVNLITCEIYIHDLFHLINERPGAVDIIQWQSTCLACTRPWVPSWHQIK
jgi:hypothetical protein